MGILERNVLRYWFVVSVVLSVCLHSAPVWFVLFGPVYEGGENSVELDLSALSSFRERIFRDMLAARKHAIPPAMRLSVMIQSKQEEKKVRLAAPRPEEELERARLIQRSIRVLWERMDCAHAGFAVVRLHVMEDGRIGDYGVTSMQGGDAFRAFLASFLTTLQSTYGNQAGPGREMRLECEFVVKPRATEASS